LEEKVARYLFAEILIGMRYLHETINVMYRDLKPENIMIDREGHAKIIDVGLAC
jgi:serum/glucocorticoid-regulated kinase 2